MSNRNQEFNGPVLFALAMTLMSGCATTTMQSIQHASDFHVAHIHKVLVIAITRTPEMRGMVEDEFVRQLSDRGVNAVASSKVLSVALPLDKADVAPFAKAGGFDSVLVTRLLKREEIEPQIAHPKSETSPDSPGQASNLTQDVKALVASPEYPIDYEIAVLSTSLYDVATEAKVWSGLSQTLVTGDAPKLVHPFVKTILKNLYQSR